jgi:hypothetical protein
MTEQISFVRACQDYFEKDPLGKKITVPEFKALTYQDKVELRDELINQGYDVAELVKPSSEG